METGESIIKVPKKINKDEPFKVRIVIGHPNEPGTRKDPKTKELIPAHHLTNLKVMFENETVSEITIGPSISSDPTFFVMVKAAKSGTLKVIYKDNKGKTWEKTQKIKI